MIQSSYLTRLLNRDDVEDIVEKFRVEVLPQIEGKQVGLVFRGWSGGLIVPILAFQFDNLHPIVVRKNNETKHTSDKLEGELSLDAYIVIDDFVSSGETLRELKQTAQQEFKAAVQKSRTSKVPEYLGIWLWKPIGEQWGSEAAFSWEFLNNQSYSQDRCIAIYAPSQPYTKVTWQKEKTLDRETWESSDDEWEITKRRSYILGRTVYDISNKVDGVSFGHKDTLAMAKARVDELRRGRLLPEKKKEEDKSEPELMAAVVEDVKTKINLAAMSNPFEGRQFEPAFGPGI
jgi:hypoxanthine phosphoribosyltransferase